jgi:CHAT domain-containing protein
MYEGLAAALLDRAQAKGTQEDLARAYATVEQAKGRSLLEQMQRDLSDEHTTSDERADDDAKTVLLDGLRRARADLNALYSAMERDQPRDEDAARQWRQRVQARERDVDEIESRLATTRGMGDLFAETATLQDVMRMVPADNALVEYFTANETLHAFVVRNDRVSMRRGIASISDVRRGVEALQFQINRALRPGAMDGPRGSRLLADVRRELAAFTELVWSSFSKEVGDATCIGIVPHGPLHAVPFAALLIDDQWLIERHLVHTAPSATLLARLNHALTPRENFEVALGSLVVGVSDATAPQIAEEAHGIARMLGRNASSETSLLLDDQATVDAFRSAAPHASLVHLACHGRYVPETPLGSGLRLADRWFTVRDMLRLRLNARLVTLSGCETGLSSVRAGEEILGLQRGLFAAGAPSIVASIWRVDDAVTREWMTAFYGCLHTVDQRANVAHALQSAHRTVLDRHPHPAFWAPFTLAGLP